MTMPASPRFAPEGAPLKTAPGLHPSERGSEELPAAAELFEGTPYQAIRRLDSGGMGEVYLVEHRRTRRTLVAKLIHSRLAHEGRLVERLRVEAQSLAQLNHPHIVVVKDFRTASDGRPFIVMEHLQGRTLEEEIVERTLPLRDALTYVSQLLGALGAAHTLGVVHRDIKPDNLFLCEADDGGRFIKVLDFGLVRVLPDASPLAPKPVSVPTETGVVMGTPRWISPEAAMGQHVDGRADLYSAALILYVLLAGRGPFDELRGQAPLIVAHTQEPPPPPSHFSPAIPTELDQAVLKGLQKDPEQRYQTAQEFQEHLDQLAGLLDQRLASLETALFNRNLPSTPAPDAENATWPESNRAREPDSGRSSPRLQRERRLPWGLLALVFLVVTGIVAAVVVGSARLLGALQ